MPKKTYKVGEEVYDIEDSDVSSFLKDMPDAKGISFLILSVNKLLSSLST